MKKLTMLTLALALVAVSVSAADDAKPKAKQPPISKELLEKYDKNKDGKVDKNDNLTKEERQAFNAERKKAREAAPTK